MTATNTNTDTDTDLARRRSDFRFLHRLRVRWAEVDMQKIVFNAHYLMYFDTGVADYWRALALPYEDAMRELGGDLYVKKATLQYHASARLDDRIDVALRCARIGNSSLLFQGTIFRGADALVTCELLYVFADPATQTSKPVPPALREIMLGYESGEAVTRLRTGSWSELGAGAAQVRTMVFVQEQRIPAEVEWDENDHTALHVVVSNRLGQPLGTGRLIQHAPGIGKIGRVAVHPAVRGSGVAQQVMGALRDAARSRGDHEIVLHAQRSAESFYARLGFVARGAPFDEVGIAHIEMAAPLFRPAQG